MTSSENFIAARRMLKALDGFSALQRLSSPSHRLARENTTPCDRADLQAATWPQRAAHVRKQDAHGEVRPCTHGVKARMCLLE